MSGKSIVRSPYTLQMSSVSVTQSVIGFVNQYRGIICMWRETGGHGIVHQGFNEHSWYAQSGAGEVGVLETSAPGTTYDALAEIEARGFYPAFACELLALWEVSKDPWRKHFRVLGLGDACRGYSYKYRHAVALNRLNSSAQAELCGGNDEPWGLQGYLWKVSGSSDVLPQGTAIAVTKPGNRDSFWSLLLFEEDSELNLIRVAQARARALFARNTADPEQALTAAMIGSLLAEISSKFDLIPDVVEHLDGVERAIKSGIVLGYNEQVDVYNSLLDIKNILLGLDRGE